MVNIPDDWWTGSQCLGNEIPWTTPGSVRRLDELCRPTDTVLEVSSGGSTLFYARRCRHVIAIETNPSWHASVRDALAAKKIDNVSLLLIPEQADIEDFLKSVPDDRSIISIDSVHGYNRSAFLEIALKKLATRILLLDNYASDSLFFSHHTKSIADMIALCPAGNWQGEDFDDPNSHGRGTRILHREA